MCRDDDVIRRAQLWATGATIHDVNNLLGTYKAATYYLDHPGQWSPAREVRLRFVEAVCVARNRLEHFMATGDIKAARRLYPFHTLPELEALYGAEADALDAQGGVG